MRVLGIDPGLTRCGMGVVEGQVGRPLTLVDVNVLRTSSDLPVAQRLVTIEKGVDAWLDEYAPDAVAVERVFARSDVSTVMGTAQASGIALVCAARRGLPVALHTPSEVKAAVSGSGRANKAQVGAMVTRILRLDAPPKPADAADALALAITHIWRGGAQARIDAALAARRPDRARSLEQMIAFVRGEVAAVTLSSAVLEVGGVGLELMCTPGTLSTLRTGHQATLPTSMVVREDSLTLFGFLDEDEKSVFELVQTASGVGPKLAQAMIAVLTPDDLRRAVVLRRRQDADPGARHRAEGRPADHPRAQGPPRRPGRRSRLPRRRLRRGRPVARPGAPGPGRPRLARPGRREGGRRGRPRGRRRRRTSAPCSGPPCAP